MSVLSVWNPWDDTRTLVYIGLLTLCIGCGRACSCAVVLHVAAATVDAVRPLPKAKRWYRELERCLWCVGSAEPSTSKSACATRVGTRQCVCRVGRSADAVVSGRRVHVSRRRFLSRSPKIDLRSFRRKAPRKQIHKKSTHRTASLVPNTVLHRQGIFSFGGLRVLVLDEAEADEARDLDCEPWSHLRTSKAKRCGGR